MPRPDIQEFATALAVPYLVHFTKALHIPSIMEHGIYPIGRTNEINAAPQVNDVLRLDGHTDSTSASIAFPNSRMLFKYRKADPHMDWVVLAITRDALWGLDCAFCRHNAADARVRYRPLAELKTLGAFQELYVELESGPTRAEQQLKPYDPSDEQAEVLIFDVIRPELIVGAAFERENVRALYAPHLAGRTTVVHGNLPGLFSGRKYARARNY